MRFQTEAEIRALVDGFEGRTLPKVQWTHQAHLTVGLWFLLRYSEKEVLAQLRPLISSYNVSVGTVNSDASGYHETLTRFFVHQISEWLQRVRDRSDVVALFNQLMDSPLADKNVPITYYSKELLMSVRARRDWVEPDLRPLD